MMQQPLGQGDKVEFDSLVITSNDLQCLRMAATDGPGAVAHRTREAEAATKAEGQARAKARKEKMLAIEATRKANLPKSDLEKEDEETYKGG